MSEHHATSFEGVVILKDWMPDPRSHKQIRGFIGSVDILGAEAALGFRTASTESNWIAKITGVVDVDGVELVTESVYVPGCQVRALFQTDQATDLGDFAFVGKRDES